MMDGQCPLKPQTFLKWKQPIMGLRHVQAIDDHILAKNCFHPRPLKEFTFNGSLQGGTPLLLACHYGEFDSVKHIVECWGVDVRAAAKYHLSPSRAHIGYTAKIEKATPLFVAALQGHSKIVRYLLEKGAGVNVKTSNKTNQPEYDGLTPLYGAVLHNHAVPGQSFEERRAETNAIVCTLLEFGADVASASFRPSDGRPIWMQPMCGFDATAALINHGLDLKLRDPLPYDCGTILHCWAGLPSCSTEEQSLSIVKLLLNKDADLLYLQNNRGFSPILSAANSKKPGVLPNLAVLDYLLERDDVTREEKIEAMELAGAAILSDCVGDEQLVPKAFDYWRRALHLRLIQSANSHPIIKTPLMRLSGGKVEWVTLDQLETIFQQPFEYNIQGFLVRLRILSGKSWAAVIEFCIPYFYNFVFERYLELGQRLDLIVEILWAMLDTIRLFDRKQKNLWELTVLITHFLMRTLSTLETRDPALANHETTKTSLQLIVATDQFHLDNRESFYDADQYSMGILFPAIKMLITVPEMLTINTMKWLFQVVHRNKPERFGTRLLHMACQDEGNIHYFATIRLLLDAGTDPNAVDEVGNAPLHVVARLPRELMDPAARLLLESGAHLDRANNSGKTAADIWIECNEMEDDQDEDDGARWNARPDWCRATRSLSCLSARVMRSNLVPYEDGDLPATLNPFVDMH